MSILPSIPPSIITSISSYLGQRVKAEEKPSSLVESNEHSLSGKGKLEIDESRDERDLIEPEDFDLDQLREELRSMLPPKDQIFKLNYPTVQRTYKQYCLLLEIQEHELEESDAIFVDRDIDLYQAKIKLTDVLSKFPHVPRTLDPPLQDWYSDKEALERVTLALECILELGEETKNTYVVIAYSQKEGKEEENYKVMTRGYEGLWDFQLSEPFDGWLLKMIRCYFWPFGERYHEDYVNFESNFENSFQRLFKEVKSKYSKKEISFRCFPEKV